jgi:hypothetical protein
MEEKHGVELAPAARGLAPSATPLLCADVGALPPVGNPSPRGRSLCLSGVAHDTKMEARVSPRRRREQGGGGVYGNTPPPLWVITC